MKNVMKLLVVWGALVSQPSTLLIADDSPVLLAGQAAVEITDRQAGPVNDPSYVKALVLRRGATTAVLVTVDAVAIGGIGRIGDDYLPRVRGELRTELGIAPECVLVNASHCHSLIRHDVAELTVQAVRQAHGAMVPVQVGVGSGEDATLSENRRLQLKDGSEIDMRRAYSLPPGDQVERVGPIDPTIGVVRLDRVDGRPLAVIYHFACHPIMGAANHGNTAGFPGFASRLLEDAMGEGTLAFFVQGCAGDVNPVNYKQATHPRDGEQLGHRLGASVLRIWREIMPTDSAELAISQRLVEVPLARDYPQRLEALETTQRELLEQLQPTDLDFKSFLPLLIQHRLDPDAPTAHIQTYLHEQSQSRGDQRRFDETTRQQLAGYIRNIEIMETLTRLKVNRALLEKNQALVQARDGKPLPAELVGLRLGDFRLITFPGELTVAIGLDLKQSSPHAATFVSGYSNGYYFYLPNERQRRNIGFAQEDCDCIVDPQWQSNFETAAIEILNGL